MPGPRQVLFQLHWFLGITAGTLLLVIGLSGALLSFREEIVDAITPGGRHVPVAERPMLAPAELLEAVRAAHDGRAIGTLTLSSEAGHAARVLFAPPPGQRRGETIHVDPYTGAQLPPLRAEPFFEWVESLHRWLLLPREAGRVVAGILAASLLFLSLSGLYLRWPRRALQWRAWLTFDTALKGRSFLWGLHSVAGTLALVFYVMFTLTGLYWAYDWIRDPIDRAAGDPRPPRTAQPPRPAGMEAKAKPRADAPPADIRAAWQAFERKAAESGGWAEAGVRVPAAGAKQLQITWLAHGASHERARDRMTISLPAAEITQDERHEAKTAARQALTVIYPLHLGTYFGLPGRILNTLAALMLPLFTITGWMLYLDRRRKKRAVAHEQAALIAGAMPAPRGDEPPVLVAYASQTGTAEGIALRSAALLRAAGVAVTVAPLAELDPERLRHHRRLLLVASSFGEGEAPDSARRAARLLAATAAPALAHLRYGLLALGDRHYARFCGFGHALDHALESAGATRLFPTIEVDDGDPAALAQWSRALAADFSLGDATMAPDQTLPLQRWQLVERCLLNPASVGAPLYRIDLLPLAGAAMQWRAGALVELMPRHADEAVRPMLAAAGFDADAPVRHAGRGTTLAEALAASVLPTPQALQGAAGRPQALADALEPLALRRYSAASLPQEGRLRLLVRQARHEGGLGLASGWLTAHAPLHGEISLAVLHNPAFAPVDDDAPALFIGNGSGYAGLRAHLLARIAAGRRRNWLLFGERQQAHDAFCADELQQWQAEGWLERCDLVFSRDQPERLYVQDRLRDQAELLRGWMDEAACVYVCGSLSTMAVGVEDALRDILGEPALEALIESGRYRRDVY
ncbi:PepSY domain-containing protein [Xylophilus rhododendri]|uniref:PepSY domain-containing protein n=1 Tax=Xylophilus rhododendri TaxID=2697032 RepID=UPI001E3A7F0E|nr:sulfite reductase flavoprotein subunit alpha [Xylophilus rhododendri]